MKPSNLLVIMSDEHQARALGCAGHPLARTPHLDALASRGMRFENAYTPSPICVPARAGFATGRYVHQTRLWDNAMPYTGEIKGWGHALQEKGVPVESIGKLHYRDAEDPAGFDVEHIPMMVQDGIGMAWALIRAEDQRLQPGQRMLGDHIGAGRSKYTDYDAAVTRQTRDWLETRAGAGDERPWCLYVGLVAPHFPLVVPQEYFDLYPAEQLPATKLRPKDGYRRHPWVEKQNAVMDTESHFVDEDERLRAISSYFGLCSWLDFNVGEILSALEETGYLDDTTIVYTSDHGDNVGARGLWGKSNLYQESVHIPLIMAGPDVPVGVCETPVSLLDLSKTIAMHFGADIESAPQLASLYAIAGQPDLPERIAFSEYHAIGSVSGGYMVRKGRWKYHHYVGFPPELFDLENDPEERIDLAGDPAHGQILATMERVLRTIVDPDATNAQALADQAALVIQLGGPEIVRGLGPKAATPPPEI
ncbi:MAG: sulfatase-like hydrolase/transferase [Rhizobiaceae bacterium]|nr:sulfatase-like hydrolase/transferase [Rhizobiaceae bacterium]